MAVPRYKRLSPLSEEIIEVLHKHGPRTLQEIAVYLDRDPRELDDAMRELRRREIITRHSVDSSAIRRWRLM